VPSIGVAEDRESREEKGVRVMCKIVYFTLDSCNLYLAGRFRGINGNTVLPMLKIPRLDHLDADRVVIDLDHMPLAVCDETIAQLLDGQWPFAVAVHSNNLSDERAGELKAARIHVHEGLLEEVLFQ
jgi:hypothetical protein